MKNEKNAAFEKKCGEKTEKQENYITEFRHNIDREMEQRGWTIRETAEKSDMTFETLKNFLYDKDAKDCRLSTVIKFARAFDMSLDELVGMGTYSDDTLECISLYRKLPASSRSLVKWHLKDQSFNHTKHQGHRIISIMNPICSNNGNLKKTNDYDRLDIGELDKELMHKVFFGIRIPCDHYLPHYMKDDILLLANDRDAFKSENTVIIVNGNIVITKRVVENGVSKYYGIRDGLFRISEPDHVQVIGYIAKVISE